MVRWHEQGLYKDQVHLRVSICFLDLMRNLSLQAKPAGYANHSCSYKHPSHRLQRILFQRKCDNIGELTRIICTVLLGARHLLEDCNPRSMLPLDYDRLLHAAHSV